jgi:hypothetical protein
MPALEVHDPNDPLPEFFFKRSLDRTFPLERHKYISLG